jgi:DNA polymerase-1
VRRLTTTLGGTPVTVYAPRPGTLDRNTLADLFHSEGLYGLDVESTYMDAAGPWSPNYQLRTVQFATKHAAIVLRMDDPEQVQAARDIVDPAGGREFTSHSQIDTVALYTALGADITDRNLDTHWLSIMAAPDDTKGGADLKAQCVTHGMPELQRADKALGRLFDRMYRETHPEVGRRAVKVSTLEAWGFNHVSLDDPVFFGYAGLDAIAVRRLADLLVAAVAAPVHLLRTERFLSTEATRIRLRGHRVDVEALDALQSVTEAEVTEVSGIIVERSGLKPTQNVKLVEWFGEHGAHWEGHPLTDGGKPSLAKEAGIRLLSYPLDEDGRAVAEAFIRHAKVLDRSRKTAAIRDGMVKDSDGLWRIHPTLLSIGTVTGRMSSSGPNMQNFSKKDPAMRGLFLPEPGHLFLSCDFAQIELRVLAALAGEGQMIGVIMGGGDLHQLTADLLDITRQEAKTVNFLIVYGGGGGRLAAQLKYARTEDECRAIIRTYWERYPAISELKESLTALQHEVRLISGRLVPVGRTKDGGSRAYANLNYLIQGSARELLAGAWQMFARRGPAFARMVWMAVHDEMVLNVPEDRVDEVAGRIESDMTMEFLGVPVAAEADVLLDRAGVSRWMPGDMAREIRLELAA